MGKQSHWTIYCHTHKDSGRRFIGSTKLTWRRRWNQRVHTAKKSVGGWSRIANALRKYGKDAFDHEVLEVCGTLEEANAVEEKWIAHFDTTNPIRGFNLSDSCRAPRGKQSKQFLSEDELRKKRWTIYCHIHRESGRRYVGITSKSWRKRWNDHASAAKRAKKDGRSHFANAIRKYGKDAFSHEVLEVCISLEVANAAEVRWIAHFNTTDSEKGFNLAPGGGHLPHPVKNPWDRPEYRKKMLAKDCAQHLQTPVARAKQLASMRSPESRRKRSSATRAALARPETRRKREVMRADPAYKAQISESLKASLASDEARARMSEASRRSATPEVREKRSASLKESMSRPEVKKKLSASSKAAWSDPEYREKVLSRKISDETRAKISAAGTGRRHSPESVQRQRELYLRRSSSCKFCGDGIEGKRTCINGRVSCRACRGLHDRGEASFLRPDGSFV